MIVKNSGLSLCLAVVLAGFSINGLAPEAKTEKDKKKATTVIVVVPEKETAGSAGEPVADKRVNGPTNATASSNKKRASKRPLTAEEYQEAQAAAFRRYGNDFDTPFFK